MPPARWTRTALHCILGTNPHTMVRTIHGLGYQFQAHSPFFLIQSIQIFLVLLLPVYLFEHEYYQKYCRQLT